MLERLSVRTFKSLADVDVDLGLVNVFIGANGSGKSNLLEALGVLSAAADGKVDDQALLNRGVRPGLPALYKSAFPRAGEGGIPPHIFFGGYGNGSVYEVALHNPLDDPAPAWRFKTERWDYDDCHLAGRSPRQGDRINAERGLAALRAVEVGSGPPRDFLHMLQDYVIFSPTTAVLRGVAPETQPKQPLGLSGGRLPRAVSDLLKQRRRTPHSKRVAADAVRLLGWAKSFGAGPSSRMALSPAAATSDWVIRFRDRYMREDRGMVSGYDAAEGALYVLFLAVLAGHTASPSLCAVDNADHGLNPRLARSLIESLCRWYLDADEERQILLTTHNPLVLDGLPLEDERVRLFTLARTNKGRSTVRRVVISKKLRKKGKEGWTLSRLWTMGHLGGVPDV